MCWPCVVTRPADKEWDWSTAHFRHASDLVAFAREQQPGMGISVAAYPAPHPESRTFAEDRLHTANKLRAGADFALPSSFLTRANTKIW